MVPKYSDEEVNFVLACLRTCEDNLWETILGCIIEDDILVGVALLVAKRPYYSEEEELPCCRPGIQKVQFTFEINNLFRLLHDRLILLRSNTDIFSNDDISSMR